MTGILASNFHEGTRSEYLGVYLLSSFASVVPVPRQEDYGADLYCALTEKRNGNLHAQETFAVQLKSRSQDNEIVYGGSKDGKWKDYEVDWLFSQQLPFFIGLVTKETATLDLYAVSNAWYTKWMSGTSFILALQPDEPSTVAEKLPHPTEASGNGRRYWKVPLGPPLVSIKIGDLSNDTLLRETRQILRRAIGLEKVNIFCHNQGVPFSTWIVGLWKPNEMPTDVKVGQQWYFNPGEGMNLEAITRSLGFTLPSLAFNLKAQNNSKLTQFLEALAVVNDIIPNAIPKSVMEKFDENNSH